MELKNILIIDDDYYIREFLKDALESENYQVATTANGEDGISVFKEGSFDMAIVDMVLPDTNGIEVLKKIKEIKKETIVIIITGHANIQNVVESMRLGAYNYLTKPISLQTLYTEIESALEYRERILSKKFQMDSISINGVQSLCGLTTF